MREMKLSCIRYIGKVPLDWQVRRVKTLTICLDGARIPVDATKRIDGVYPYWGAGNIVGYVNDYIFDETIVLLGEDGAPFYDDSRPVAFLSTGKVWVNNHIHVLKNRESIIPGYLTYALNSVDYHGYLSGSIFPKLTQSSMNEIYLAVPSVEEQHTIVAFLDSKCAAIDEAIERHKKKTVKLEEYRCSLISNYMTRTAGVKTRIKFVGSVQTGPFGTQLNASEYVDEGIPCINVKNIKNGYISEENVDKVPLSVIQRLPAHVLLTGDIVFARKGSIDKHAIVSKHEDGWLQGSDCIRLRLIDKYNPEYINYNLSSQYVKDYLFSVANGSTMPSLNSDMIKELPVIIHDIDEQKIIVEELNVVTEKIDQAIQKSMEIVSKLQEYRKSLIYHAVTGKIDCRGANVS